MTYQNTESNDPNINPQTTEINISQRVIEFLQVLRGVNISTVEVEKINSGEYDLLSGEVIFQNYDSNSENLTQVTIQTPKGENFTLSNNEHFKLNPEIFVTLANTYLINRPAVVYIKNLNDFIDRFQDASKYKQDVACIYSRLDYCMKFVNIFSNKGPIPRDYEKSAACHGWNCPSKGP